MDRIETRNAIGDLQDEVDVAADGSVLVVAPDWSQLRAYEEGEIALAYPVKGESLAEVQLPDPHEPGREEREAADRFVDALVDVDSSVIEDSFHSAVPAIEATVSLLDVFSIRNDFTLAGEPEPHPLGFTYPLEGGLPGTVFGTVLAPEDGEWKIVDYVLGSINNAPIDFSD